MDDRKFTPERIKEEFSEKRPDLIVCSEPDSLRGKVTVKSKTCGHIWTTWCSNLLYKNTTCSICFHKTDGMEEYKAKLAAVRPRIEVISEEMGKSSEKLKYRCLDCGLIFEANRHKFFARESGHGCPRCGHVQGGKKNAMSHEEFVCKVSMISPEIEVLGKYTTCNVKIECMCKRCGHVWRVIGRDLIKSQKPTGCPKCKMTYGERFIARWLDNHSIEYDPQHKFEDCKDKMELPFDFYLPEYNACIEFDGEQHFKPIKYFGGMKHLIWTISHDEIKDNYCSENNITLWRIAYFHDEDYIDEELSILLLHCTSKCIIENEWDTSKRKPRESGLL